jgi:hypothetical protein
MTAKGTTELNECISVVSRRAYTRIPRQTRWTLCRSAQRRWSLEADPTMENQKRRTHLTRRRRQRLNKRHEPLRRRRPQLPAEIRRSTPRLLADVLAAKLYTAFQNITNVPKTPTSPALEPTPTSRPQRRSIPKDEALYEFNRDAGNCSKKPNAQTRHPTGGAPSPPTTYLHGRKTAEGLHLTGSLRTYRPKRLSARASPRTDYTCSKKYKALLDLYIATESKNRGPCNMMPEGHTCRVPRKAPLKKAPDGPPAGEPRRTPHR